jgi:hypothetical protein
LENTKNKRMFPFNITIVLILPKGDTVQAMTKVNFYWSWMRNWTACSTSDEPKWKTSTQFELALCDDKTNQGFGLKK